MRAVVGVSSDLTTRHPACGVQSMLAMHHKDMSFRPKPHGRPDRPKNSGDTCVSSGFKERRCCAAEVYTRVNFNDARRALTRDGTPALFLRLITGNPGDVFLLLEEVPSCSKRQGL